jgi:outer membrane protein insertion porin family
MPKTYEIAGVNVSGVPADNEFAIVGFSGLNVGERIEIPGQVISTSVKRFWRQGLYSRVQIKVSKMVGDKVWLEIVLRQQPRLSELRYTGVTSGERKDLNERLAMVSGQQLTPNIVARAKQVVEKFYGDKGFKNATVTVRQVPDVSKENYAFLDFDVTKSNKVKVHKIYVEGNEVLSDRGVKKAMKKTNENGNILNLFKQKKFVDQDYADDKERIIQKYNELGYRDARIISDRCLPQCGGGSTLLHQRYLLGGQHRI